MDIAREVAAVVFVLALLGGVLWAVRRAGPAFPRIFSGKVPARVRRLAALERVALTPQHTLHLVRFGGRELVVSTYPQGCSVLAGEPMPCADAAAVNLTGTGASA